MYHLAAYYKDITTATLMELEEVPDGIFASTNKHLQPPADAQLIWAYAAGSALERVQIETPFLRQVVSPWIRPIANSLVPISLPEVAWYLDTTFRFRALEEIIVRGYQASGGNDDTVVLLAIGDSLQPVPGGMYYTLRGTVAPAYTAFVWNLIPPSDITWDVQLPQGRYALCGIDAIASEGIGLRTTFDGQFYRPGVLTSAALVDLHDPKFTDHRVGKFGEFPQTNFPRFELFPSATNAAGDLEIYMQLVKVA